MTHHKPVARGVSQLMYVGDTEPPRERPILINVGPLAIAALIAWLLLRR